MEQQYGLSPRGDKPVTKHPRNGFPDLGKHMKNLSSSLEDLTRLDRHQPIIIQNFELLNPSQVKFRRRSLSTANLFLSQASLSRSGINSLDDRSEMIVTGDRQSAVPLWSNDKSKESILRKNNAHSSSSFSSPTISSRQRGKHKQKRVTFSAQNTLYPCEPDFQTPRFNSMQEMNQFLRSEYMYNYNPKSETSRQFYEPLCQPSLGELASKHFNNNNSNSINNNSTNTYAYTDNAMCDVTTYNEQWMPDASLNSPKNNGKHARSGLPQHSSQKLTMAANSLEVKRGQSSLSDRCPKVHGKGIRVQSDTQSSTHSSLEQGTSGGHRGALKCSGDNGLRPNLSGDNGLRPNLSGDNGLRPNLSHMEEGDSDVTTNGIKANISIDNISTKIIPGNQKSDKDSDINPTKENSSADDFSSNVNDNNDENDEDVCNDNESTVAHSELEPPCYIDDFTNDDSALHCNDTFVKITNGTKDTNTDYKDNVEPTATFFDVFSNYNVPDCEYMTSNTRKSGGITANIRNNISQNSHTSEELVLADSKALQPTLNLTPIRAKINDDIPDTTTLSNSKVIRLKFLVDSDKEKDNKLKNLIANGEEINGLETSHGKCWESNSNNTTTSLLSNLTSSITTRPSSKSALARHLKTKSTIEAVDLSTLALVANDQPKSQGDTNAQFLMNMYSPSGDRKAIEDVDSEGNNNITIDGGILQSRPSRPPSRKPTDKMVSFCVEEEFDHVRYRDPLSSSSAGRKKERQLLSSSKMRHRAHSLHSEPLLKHRSSSAHGMMVTGNRMMGKERVVAAEKFLLKTGNSRSSDRTSLNRQLEKLIVSRSVSARVKLTMERSRSNLI